MAKSQWYVQAAGAQPQPPVAPASPNPAAPIPAPFLRRWTIPLVGVTLLAVIGLLSPKIVLIKTAGKRRERPAADEPTNPATEGRDKPLPEKEMPVKPSEEISVRPAVARWEPPAVAKPAPM